MAQNSSPIIPGKPIITGYPTPVLDDRIYRVRKDSRVADYVVPKPGTPFDGKREFEDKLEGFVFATAVPVADPSQAEMVDWYYLNERDNQDSYNFSIEYPYSDPDCPRLTRTYVYLRGSEPPPLLSDVDPIFTELKLVDQKQTRLQDPILDSIFTALERTYECLPSPAITAVADRPEHVLPFNMRVALPTTEESHAEQGAASTPTMADNDWHKQEQQQTLFRKLVTSVKRNLPNGGIMLNFGRKLTRDQQVATVVSKWKAGGQEITPSATLIEASVEDIGNNTTVKEEVTVDEVFPEKVFAVDRPEILPTMFRAAIPSTTTEETLEGQAALPVLAAGDIARSETQKTDFIKRIKRVTRNLIGDLATLHGSIFGQWGTETQTFEIVDDNAPADSGQDVISSKVEPLGDGTALRETLRLPPTTGQLKTRSVGQDNLIPVKYRRLIEHKETVSLVNSSFVIPSTLTGDQTFVEAADETIDRARLKIVEEIIHTDESALQGSRTGEFGLLVITEEIVDDGTPALVGELIQTSEVTPLGNGKSIRITVAYPPNLFDLQKVSKTIGQDNLIPEKYRRLVKHIETEKPVPVNYTFPSGLTGDQSLVEFAQKTITEARLKILEEIINTSTAPLGGLQTDEYGVLSIYESIVNDGEAADEGFLIKRSTVTPLGNGKSIKITLAYPDNLASIRLKGQTLHRQTNATIPFIKRIAPMGTEIGSPGKEINPIDIWRAEITETDLTTLSTTLGAIMIDFAGVTHLQLPDVLVEVKYLLEINKGDGYAEDKSASTSIVGTGFDISAAGSAQSRGNAYAMPQLLPVIRETWANNVPTRRFIFFMPQGFTTADVISKIEAHLAATVLPWPAFAPNEHTLACTGIRAKVDASANVKYGVNQSPTGVGTVGTKGFGWSKDVDILVSTTHIKATIHGTITPTYILPLPPGSHIVAPTAHSEAHVLADLGVFGNLKKDQITDQVTGYSVYPSSIAATTGATDIPTTGLHLLDINAELFEFGFMLVHAEVFNFADMPDSSGGGGVFVPPPAPDDSAPTIRYDSFVISSTQAQLNGTINPT